MPSPFVTALSSVCTSTVVWQRMTGRNAYGKPTFADPVTYAPPTGGRRQFTSVRHSAGLGAVDFVQGSIIYVLADLDGITLEDRVYLQGETEPYPPIMSWERSPDASGAVPCTKVIMGSALGMPGGLSH